MAKDKKQQKLLQWWQLSLLGIACTIGTGFFLGSSIGITMAGPSVILSFALAGLGTYFVYEALAKMTIENPQKGSFREYARKAYGRWAGFSSGWVYWASEMLITGSQMTALGIFSQFWFPTIPLWVLAGGYALLALVVIISGPKGFDRVENMLAVLKLSAIIIFILLAIGGLIGIFNGGPENFLLPTTYNTLFPNGLRGFLPSLIFGFYGFAGIEIIGLLAIRLKHKKDALKAGKIMLTVLAIIYITSLFLAIVIVHWDGITTENSPFVTALNRYNLPYVSHIFNGVFIIAGFSTMVASLFAVIRILVTLAEDKDAPPLFAKKIKGKFPFYAIGFTTGGLFISVILSLIMPGRIYEYFTTAAGLMLLYNWFFILGSYGRLHKLTTLDQIKRMVGFIIVLFAIGGTVFHHTSRPGFYVSIIFIAIIALITFFMRGYWRNRSTKERKEPPHSLFTKIKQ